MRKNNFLFESVKKNRIPKSAFDMSHEVKMTANVGKLVPTMCQEVLPGDVFKNKTDVVCRLAPMTAPMMQRVDLFCHYFFVPNRLLWADWREFITGGRSGEEQPVFPYFTYRGLIQYALSVGSPAVLERSITILTGEANENDVTSVEKPLYGILKTGSLLDYFGYMPFDLREMNAPTTLDQISTQKMSILPLMAYRLIYDEYYCDQNLEEVYEHFEALKESEGEVDYAHFVGLLQILNRAWQKDYFTSALPWTQRGSEATFNVGNAGDYAVVPDGLGYIQFSNGHGLDNAVVGIPGSGSTTPYNAPVLGVTSLEDGATVTQDDIQALKYESGLKVSLPGETTTINALRRSIAMQRFLENNARGGSRYIEQILSHFGVMSSDARLQRPEYIGGGRQPISVSEVLQHSETDQTPLGEMGGRGISVGITNTFTKSFEEHGYIIGILSIIPEASYFQGLPRHLQRFDKFDYAFPELAHLGEMEVKNKELYFNVTNGGDETVNEGVFGYQSQYADYKFNLSRIHGDFRNSLANWHMARKFENLPPLNADFVHVQSDGSTNRPFATQYTQDHKYWIDMYHTCTAIRRLPKYGVPIL